MSDEYVPCKLVGGRFDGDQGGILPPLPESLWAYACGAKPSECDYKGVHWAFDREAVPTDKQSIQYRRGPVGAGDQQLYLHSAIDPDELVGEAERAEPEPRVEREPVAV